MGTGRGSSAASRGGSRAPEARRGRRPRAKRTLPRARVRALPRQLSRRRGAAGGRYPGSSDPADTARRLARFEARGVTLYVDLTHPADCLELIATAYSDRVPGGYAYSIVDFGTTTIPRHYPDSRRRRRRSRRRRGRVRPLLGRDRPDRHRRRVLARASRVRRRRSDRAHRRAPAGLVRRLRRFSPDVVPACDG